MMKIGSTEWKRLISEGAGAFDIHLDSRQVDLCAVHAVELLRWNRKFNLTTITDSVEVAVKHFIDAMAPAGIIPSNAELLDIGSGGGFPGIPLKILMPSLSATLIDASRKKVNFMKHVIRTLKLKDISVRHARAQGFSIVDFEAPGDPKDNFDVIISRAVTSLENFIPMALPLLARGGSLIALKGKVSEEEIESARMCMLEMSEMGQTHVSIDLKTYALPYLKSERSIVTVKRIRNKSL
ncbi:MAG: 16S rRNA (guanine(527)-N(7))-methyltransferase RsmG [Deltaproteobacteria bacterium]|nr:16S rRNA (guanine(527)-N(7))-methyltransferase RsmG [Deltaproteobacteria bacterium]